MSLESPESYAEPMLSQALLTHASVLSKFYNYCIPHSSGYLASTDGLLSYQAKLLQ